MKTVMLYMLIAVVWAIGWTCQPTGAHLLPTGYYDDPELPRIEPDSWGAIKASQKARRCSSFFEYGTPINVACIHLDTPAVVNELKRARSGPPSTTPPYLKEVRFRRNSGITLCSK